MSITPEALRDLALNALDDLKAKDVVSLDVKPLTSMADYMIVASGTSNRHVKSMADHVVETSKKQGCPPVGVEGDNSAEWTLVDLGAVIVHIMLPDTRKFYDLEKLWSMSPDDSSDA